MLEPIKFRAQTHKGKLPDLFIDEQQVGIIQSIAVLMDKVNEIVEYLNED